MNQRTDALMKTFNPQLLIAVYAPTGSWMDAYLESHEVDTKGRILEGRPLKQETIDGLVDVFYQERQQRSEISGLLPHNMLHFQQLSGGGHELIWYRPAEKRQLFFAEKLHIPSGEAWVPPMIYHVHKRQMEVFAWEDDGSRPTEKTQLLRAPFHNVSGSGDVCLGSAKAKKPETNTIAALLKYWEDMFWLSEFTHLAGSENPTKTNVNLIWRQLIGSETKWSDLGELLPIKNTLEDLLP
ncbi:hypothetical protein [Flavihumibacter petaseus]|uniref:PRTRC system protein B n=1 Tax=Flavihumibacter petaseus NBRC 106054 TaxID=1220578 RepID=A0A0E9N1N3_9BACT|nr:hypothetical protein [Flavihumibacter petaseus]GAO43764.1 hypothetical protein FPE01S_02_08700 [Flavihumibacter petaseus NBRC 106054]